jgi:excisionase family DNA binding protein
MSKQEPDAIVQNDVQQDTGLPTRLLRIEEVADILQVSRSYCYQMVQRNEIPSVRLGRTRRIRVQDLEGFIEANISGSNGVYAKGGAK